MTYVAFQDDIASNYALLSTEQYKHDLSVALRGTSPKMYPMRTSSSLYQQYKKHCNVLLSSSGNCWLKSQQAIQVEKRRRDRWLSRMDESDLSRKVCEKILFLQCYNLRLQPEFLEFTEPSDKSIIWTGQGTKNKSTNLSYSTSNKRAKAEKLVTGTINKHLGTLQELSATTVFLMEKFHSNFGELVTLAKNSYHSWMLSQTLQDVQKEYFEKTAKKPFIKFNPRI